MWCCIFSGFVQCIIVQRPSEVNKVTSHYHPGRPGKTSGWAYCSSSADLGCLSDFCLVSSHIYSVMQRSGLHLLQDSLLLLLLRKDLCVSGISQTLPWCSWIMGNKLNKRCLKVEVQYCVTSHLTRIADRVIIVMQTTVSYKWIQCLNQQWVRK